MLHRQILIKMYFIEVLKAPLPLQFQNALYERLRKVDESANHDSNTRQSISKTVMNVSRSSDEMCLVDIS